VFEEAGFKKVAWLQDKNGSIFHWSYEAITGNGMVSSPDSPLVLPSSADATTHHNDVLTIEFSQGKIISHLNKNNRKGKCVRCGLCCIDCPHLALLYPMALGKENGTACKIYYTRLYEGLKGCVLFPEKFNDLSTEARKVCGFRFK